MLRGLGNGLDAVIIRAPAGDASSVHAMPKHTTYLAVGTRAGPTNQAITIGALALDTSAGGAQPTDSITIGALTLDAVASTLPIYARVSALAIHAHATAGAVDAMHPRRWAFSRWAIGPQQSDVVLAPCLNGPAPGRVVDVQRVGACAGDDGSWPEAQGIGHG